MFCSNCGTKNDDTATPCKKCGFKLTAAPKFRGTMMLNSEQSVQEMVEAHRRKLTEAGDTGDPAAKPVGSVPPTGSRPPPSDLPGAPKAVLQPPRVGLGKKRMGTMLGVAPQVGGVRPPEPSPSPAVPAVSPRTLASTGEEPAVPSVPDPFAGTVAFGAVSPLAAAPPAPAAAAGRTEAFATPAPTPRPAAAGRTEALAATPSPAAAGRTEAFQAVPANAPSPLAAGRTEAFAAMPEPAAPAAPARGRTEAFEMAAPAAATPARGRTEAFEAPPTPVSTLDREPPPSSAPPPPRRRRVRPFEVFLIVITFGLYGLVLLARQSKPRRPTDQP